MTPSKKAADGLDKRVVIAVAAFAVLLVAFLGYRALQPEPYRATPPNGYRGMAEEDRMGRPSTAPQ